MRFDLFQRSPFLGGPRLGQLTCCVEGAPGAQTRKCFDTGSGQCLQSWAEFGGDFPGVPACIGGLPPNCPAGGPPPAGVPLPPAPTEAVPPEAPLEMPAAPTQVPLAPAQGPTTPPYLGPTTEAAPPQAITIEAAPTGAFPGPAFLPSVPMAKAAPPAVLPRPAAVAPPFEPCPTEPIPIADWTRRCLFR